MLSILGAVASEGQGKETQSDQPFATFWAQFKAAVAKNDKEAVAEMTRFPVDVSENLTRAAFIKKYHAIFTQEVRRCFAKEKPVRDDPPPPSASEAAKERQKNGTYNLFCGNDIFAFERVEGKYKLTSVGFND